MREFLIWPDLASYRGAAFASQRHSHFFLQISFADSGPIELRGRDGVWHSYGVALIPSGASHEMRAAAGDLTLIYMDPLTTGRGLLADPALPPGRAAVEIENSLGPDDRQKIRACLQQPGSDARGRLLDILHKLAGEDRRKSFDPRIQRGLDELHARSEDITLGELAALTGLSLGRFRHLFREQIGIPFSGYRLWLKTHRAVRFLSGRPDLVKAAYEGGFADQAHFSRIFRRSFGMSPSVFTRGKQPFSARFFAD